jgi:DNA-binding NtrC family response regulator
MAQDTRIHPSDLGLSQNAESGPRFEEMTLEQVEGLLIRRALSRFEGDISKTAEALGLSRAALYRRLEKHQIQ